MNGEITMGRRRRSKPDEEVELNLAAMLDMAFQLLTFFILTFKPAPVEGQISLRMPPPQPLANANATKQAGETDSKDPVQGFNTLAIILTTDDSGKLAHIYVAKQEIPVNEGPLKLFNDYLKKVLNDPGSPFDQVIIQVPAKLHYSELMRVMGVCSKQTVGGDPKNKLTKLSLVEREESRIARVARGFIVARSLREPPPKMFQRSELRRLLSMAFLMVILFMVIQNSLPDNRRLLVGRDGNKDQVVQEIEEGSADQPERVPATPKSSAVRPAARKTAAGHSTIAFANANSGTPDSSTSSAKVNSPTIPRRARPRPASLLQKATNPARRLQVRRAPARRKRPRRTIRSVRRLQARGAQARQLRLFLFERIRFPRRERGNPRPISSPPHGNPLRTERQTRFQPRMGRPTKTPTKPRRPRRIWSTSMTTRSAPKFPKCRLTNGSRAGSPINPTSGWWHARNCNSRSIPKCSRVRTIFAASCINSIYMFAA